MKYYFQAFKNYADLNGRMGRKEYWLFSLVNIIVFFVFQIHGVAIDFPILGSLYVYVSVIPFASASARRLIDAGKSKFWLFAALVFPIGTAFVIWYLCMKSTDKDIKSKKNKKI